MQPSPTETISEDHASIADVVGIKEQTFYQRFITSQAFWVAVALFVLIVASIAVKQYRTTLD